MFEGRVLRSLITLRGFSGDPVAVLGSVDGEGRFFSNDPLGELQQIFRVFVLGLEVVHFGGAFVLVEVVGHEGL